ncbi:MAG: glycine cleavage system aminomethyltransferase GcvT [Thermoplasmatota archaeon]
MKETALHSKHLEAEAKLTNFGGWEMPLRFKGINDEHMAVREHAGIFDVSHMGELYLEGDEALEFMSEHCTQNITTSDIGELKYAHILNDEGGIIDDTLVNRLSEKSCYIVPNAGNTKKVYDWLVNKGGKKIIDDVSNETVMIALQGPEAERILNEVNNEDISEIKFFRSKYMEINDEIMKAFDQEWPMSDKPIVQRSGYTGEDGFEIALPNDAGKVLWDQLLKVDDPPKRCGLGARDTLRIESGFLLSGQDFDETRTPIETGWEKHVIDWDNNFVGKEKLEEIKEKEYEMLKGLIMIEKGIPRNGYDVFDDDKKIGEITSGTRSPVLKKGIALGYLEPGFHEEGTEVLIDIRGRKKKAEVKNPPFV